jgi:hypothetical protein
MRHAVGYGTPLSRAISIMVNERWRLIAAKTAMPRLMERIGTPFSMRLPPIVGGASHNLGVHLFST